MSSVVEKKIEDLYNSFLSGKYYEVEERLNKILEKNELTEKERIKIKILKGRTLWHIAWFDSNEAYLIPAITELEEAKSESKEIKDILLEFNSIYWMNVPLWIMNKFEKLEELDEILSSLLKEIEQSYSFEYKEKKARRIYFKAFSILSNMKSGRDISTSIIEEMIDLAKQSLKIFSELGNEEEINFCYRMLATLYRLTAELDKSIEFWEKSQEINSRWKNGYITSFCYRQIAFIHRFRNEDENYLKLIQKAREIYEEMGRKRGIHEIELDLGFFHKNRGRREKALEIFEESLEFFIEDNNKLKTCICYQNIGDIIYSEWGKLDSALEYFTKAYRIAVDLGEPDTPTILWSISEVHLLRGELDEALKIREEVLEESRRIGNIFTITSYLSSIANVYFHKGMLKEAQEYVEESLKLYKERNIVRGIYFNKTQMVYLAIEMKNLEMAKKHLEELKPIVERMNFVPYNQDLRFLQAKVLKIDSKINELIQAEVLLEKLLEEEMGYYLLIESLLCLCEVLIKQLLQTSDKEVLKKLIKYVSKLYELAESNKAYPLLVEALWLKSQISLLEADTETAQNLLSKAKSIAEEKGLIRLEKKISFEEKEFTKRTAQLADLGVESASLSERMKVVKINGTVSEIQKERIVDIKQEQHLVGNKLFSIKI